MTYLSLKIFKQGRLVKTKIFTDDQISIGSSEGLSLQLDEASPWHVLIERKHNVFCVLDLNSETGTWLNGKKVVDETPIASGSWIKIGSYDIQFFIGPPEEQKAAPTPPVTPPQPPAKAPPVTPAQPPTSAPPAAPSQPSTSAPPVTPAQPPTSAPPVTPAQPSTSAPPVTPSQPSTSAPPAAPSQPSTSAPPVTPSQPSTSAPPVTPAQPPTSAPPVTPAQPPTPAPPVTPAQPPASAPPVTPAQPPTSAPPAAPSQPVTPSQPPASAPPVTPAQPPASPAVSVPSVQESSPDPAPPAKGQPVIQRPIKPAQKGFWSAYAPPSKIQNLDDFLVPSIGNLIEVIVCWKERMLSVYHFFKSGDILLGGSKNCQVKFPNMLGKASYKLMTIASGAKIYVSQGIQGLLFQGKSKSARSLHKLKSGQTVVLKPYEMIKLEFPNSLKVYIRLIDKPSAIPFAGLFNLKLSEAMALFLAFLLTGLLIFYGSLYAPAFLAKETDFIEKDIRIAKVVFKPPQRTKIVEYKLGSKTKKAETKKKKPARKKPVVKSIKKPVKKVKRQTTPRPGKTGKMAGQAPGKKQPKKPKTVVGSVRPGGSLKTGKKGSSAKTVAPDPSKVGLLGAFGGGGRLSQLDKGASGSGGLLGLAEKSTGFAGTEESYGGEGIGTKTKELGSGGKGSALVGISGIKTKGKGLGHAGTGTGGLGKRGRMSIEFGSEDIDVAGEIDREAILRALKRNQSRFNLCYQRSLNEQASVQGALGMQWLISPAGRGQRARSVNNRTGSGALANCVAGVLDGLKFPKPPAGQTAKVNFTFRFGL